MIVTENFKVKEHDFIRTYSNSGRYIVRDSVSYSEACDPAEFNRIYTEGELISVDENEAEEILNIILGVNE